MQLPPSIQKVFLELHQDGLMIDAERDKRNKNYSSVIFEHGMRWRYWSIKPAGKHVETRFCYTTTANALGCYLTFVEVIKGVRKISAKRSNIAPHDTRREAKAWALKSFKKFKEVSNGQT